MRLAYAADAFIALLWLSIADRLAALGGHLEVHSQPGRGTTLAGSVPGTEAEDVS